MSFAFIDAEKAHHAIDALCRNLGVSCSGYHTAVRRPASARSHADLAHADRIAAILERSRGTCGSPRVYAELRAHGERVGRKGVARLMSAEGLRARHRRRYREATDSHPPRPVAPNTLARAFETTAPDRAWVGDVTAPWTAEGWVYFAALLELWSRRVVGGSLGEQNDTALALGTLRAAVASRVCCVARASHRRREPVRERGVRVGASAPRPRAAHEPTGQLLGQRGG